jgi:hypothetical protein
MADSKWLIKVTFEAGKIESGISEVEKIMKDAGGEIMPAGWGKDIDDEGHTLLWLEWTTTKDVEFEVWSAALKKEDGLFTNWHSHVL